MSVTSDTRAPLGPVLHRRGVGRPLVGCHDRRDRAGHRGAVLPGRGGQGCRHLGGRRGGPEGLRHRPLAADDPCRARRVPAGDRGGDRPAGRGRQPDLAARVRHPLHGGACRHRRDPEDLRVLRRPRGGLSVRDAQGAHGRWQVRAAGSRGRRGRRGDHSLERPDGADRAQAGSRAARRVHGGAEVLS